MSNEVTNNDLLNVLLGVKQDIGELKAQSATQARAFSQHVNDDKEMAEDIERLRLSAARKAGAAGVWALVAGAVGSLIGAAFSYLKH